MSTIMSHEDPSQMTAQQLRDLHERRLQALERARMGRISKVKQRKDEILGDAAKLGGLIEDNLPALRGTLCAIVSSPDCIDFAASLSYEVRRLAGAMAEDEIPQIDEDEIAPDDDSVDLDGDL